MRKALFLKSLILVLLAQQLRVKAQDRIIGLTGEPGTGKSSVIEILKGMEMQVIPETFTLLYNQAEYRVNFLVNEYAWEHPQEAHRILANIIGKHQ